VSPELRLSMLVVAVVAVAPAMLLQLREVPLLA
jgi:hypothetical protein